MWTQATLPKKGLFPSLKAEKVQEAKAERNVGNQGMKKSIRRKKTPPARKIKEGERDV